MRQGATTSREEVPEHAGEALRMRLGDAPCGPGDARHGLEPHVRERGLPGADEAGLRGLRREAVPKGGRLRREEGVGARLHPGERRHRLRIDAREGARAAAVRRGTRSRRFLSPARGTSPIPGRAFSCWTSRGGCSASRGSERHMGISLDRARGAVRARTRKAVPVWAASRIRLVFC